MIIFIVIIYLYIIISIINTYHMLHFIIISYIYIDIDDILWYNIHHIMLWLPPVQAFCKSGVTVRQAAGEMVAEVKRSLNPVHLFGSCVIHGKIVARVPIMLEIK